jgi:hypothetical protein
MYDHFTKVSSGRIVTVLGMDRREMRRSMRFRMKDSVILQILVRSLQFLPLNQNLQMPWSSLQKRVRRHVISKHG